MACLVDLVGKILDPIFDIAVRKVVHHAGYIFRYKKNIKELEEENKNLEKMMKKNKEKVEAANVRNDIVEEEVEEWRKKAEDEKGKVENLMVDKARDENMKCLKFSFPNLCSRYRMSKQAVQKKVDLAKHIGGGNFEVVARRRSPPLELELTSTGNFMKFDSRKPILELIKDKLRSGNPEDKMIGVHGAGGIGKTTSVEEVSKQLKEEGVFYEVVKGVVSRNVDVHEIQGQLAHQLRLDIASKTKVERRDAIWVRLNNEKNNLVILDDLWEEIKLTDIGIPERQGNKGCKVILTARDRNVLTKMGVRECISVEVLSKEEAWALFVEKAQPNAELRNVAESVCEECGGLPVAILAVGGALVGETNMRIWKEALDQLQNSSWENIDGIDPKMYASLRLSYDCLGTEAKSILLLCCLYPEDDNIPVDFLLFHCIARRMLDPNKNTVEKARNRIFTLVSSLKNRSLLLHGKDENHVKMHDVIRDVVLSIAKTDEQYLVKNITNYWPDESISEDMAAISVRLSKLEKIPNELVCPRLHTLWIECMDSSFQFRDNFFSGVGELTVLQLKGIRMSSTPSSLANLSKLRTLILINFQLEDMSFLKGLKSSLEVLVIENYHTKDLPMELGELSHLRVLLLNKCYNLKLIPAGVISKLTLLEELCLPDQFNICEVLSGREAEDIEISRTTLPKLSSLTRLTNLSVFISDVTLVPGLNFGNLVSYRIAVGTPFSKYGEYFKERNLKLDGITFHNKFVTLLERAEVLHLYRVKGLEKVLHNKEGKGFLELEHFCIQDYHDLEYLLGTPNRYTRNQGQYEPNSFRKLTVLRVIGCSFKFLFTSSSAKGLQQLQELHISDCNILEEIVGTEGGNDEQDHFNGMVHFSKLRKLRLSGLPKLSSFGPKIKENATVEKDSLPKGQSLFNEKIIFPSLEDLYIKSLPNIIEIWDKQVFPIKFFPHLANVEVWECEKLVIVFPSNLWAQILRKVTVKLCNEVKVVMSTTGVEASEIANDRSINFPQLHEVWLSKLINLNTFYGNSTESKPQSLFDSQGIFPALNHLEIESLPNITEIWDKQVLPTKSFPHLTYVDVRECEKLMIVFPSNLWAQILKEVVVKRCNEVKVVMSTTGVEEGEVANNCSIIFPQLRNVWLSKLENLYAFCGNSSESKPQSLFDPQVHFPTLEYVTLRKLPNIEIFKQQLSKGEVKFPFIWRLEINYGKWYYLGKPNMDYLAPQLLE